MKKLSNLKTVLLAVMLVVGSGSAWGQLLQQNFSSSSTVTDYVNSTSPSNGQWNAISTSGSGTVLSITSGALQFARGTANTGTFSRTTDFSPTPTSLIYRFDLTVSGNTTAQTTAAVWQVGAGFGIANSAEVIANVHSRIGLNWTTTGGQFSIRDIGATSNSTNFSGTQTVTWVINNSGSSLSYRAPDGTEESVGDDKADLWVGTTKALNEIAATTSTQILTDLKFAITAGTGTVAIDNILIDPIPLTPTSNTATSVTSDGFTANWSTVSGATGYRLDVATDNAFTSMVSGYNNLYVSGQSSNSQAVTGLNASTTYYYRVRAASQYSVSEFAGASSSTQNLTTSVGSSPTITVTPTLLTGFTYTEGSGPSTSQSYNLSGSNLTGGYPGNITVTGSTNYEVSTDNTNFSNSVTVAYSSATLSSTPVYVRLKSGLSVSNYNSETITNSGGGATDQTVGCSGSVTILPLYFRSQATGNWSSAASWESSSNNSTWSDATRTPSSLDYTITILNGHTVTVDAAVTADEIVIATGGTLSTGTNLTVNNGIGDDITVQNGGKIIYTGAPTYNSSTIRILTGGILSVQATSLTGNGTGVNASTHIYDNGAILEWNYPTSSPSSSGVTYFPNVDVSTVPTLRFTSGTASSIGAGSPTTINGNVEIMTGVNITLTGAGLKTIRNGVHLLGTSSLTVNTKLTCASLEIDASSTLTVSAGQQLTVSTTLTNNGTLNLLSDAADGTATILTPATISGSGTANVKQFLSGGRNWYISSPVTGETAADVLSSSTASIKPSSFVWYDETKGSTTPWTTTSSTLTVTKGYIAVNDVATPSTDGVIIFTGTLNNGDYSTATLNPLTLSSTGVKDGFNLVGNPYPSYVDWNQATKTNLNATMWYRTKESGGYKFYTYNGTSAGYGGDGIGVPANVSNLIPPMQAFWVRVVGGPGSLAFTNTMRSHLVGTNPLKAPAAKNTTQQVLRLEVSNGTNNDETVVYFNPNASDGYDNYDSPKMSNANAAIPEIYTMAGTEQLVINGLNTLIPDEELALGFTPGQTNTFTIKASEISNFDTGTRIFLKDKLLNTEQELTVGNDYSFTSDATPTANRFTLIFRAAGIATALNTGSNDQSVLVYKNVHNQITVKCSGDINNENSVSVYNAVGQKLQTKQLTSNITVLDDALTSGVYLVTVTKAGKSVTKKVILN